MKYIIVILFAGTVCNSCKKSNDLRTVASLNVVNASPGIANAKVLTPYVTGYYNQISGVSYMKNAVFTIAAGSSPISITPIFDTLKPFYTSTLTIRAGEITSLFISGASGEDITVAKDNIPYRTDSTIGVRFINLSYNSNPVNITMANTPTINEFTSVAYKSLTDFKSYSAKASNPSSYTFYVNDANGVPIISTTVTLSGRVNKNITLIFCGAVNGSGITGSNLFLVNNY